MRERKAVTEEEEEDEDEARTQAETAITATPPSDHVIQVIIAFKGWLCLCTGGQGALNNRPFKRDSILAVRLLAGGGGGGVGDRT